MPFMREERIGWQSLTFGGHYSLLGSLQEEKDDKKYRLETSQDSWESASPSRDIRGCP